MDEKFNEFCEKVASANLMLSPEEVELFNDALVSVIEGDLT